jgi:hypothetical protein
VELGVESPTAAACYDMGRGLFESELRTQSRARIVETISAWVADGRLPNHEEAAHAMLEGLYDALMEAMPDSRDPRHASADSGRHAGAVPGAFNPEVEALIRMYQLPAVDDSSGTAPDTPGT